MNGRSGLAQRMVSVAQLQRSCILSSQVSKPAAFASSAAFGLVPG